MNSKPIVAILIGIQGSGKSTFYHQYLSDMVHVNLNTLRTRHREKELIQDCVENDISFAVDNTNPTRAHLSAMAELFGVYAEDLLCFRANGTEVR